MSVHGVGQASTQWDNLTSAMILSVLRNPIINRLHSILRIPLVFQICRYDSIMSKSNRPPRPRTTRTATCNCKQVEVSVNGVDRGAVLCHCDNCRKGSGSAFAHNHRFVEAELQFPRGQHLVKEYADKDTKSGNVLYRHFCSNCVFTPFVVARVVADVVIVTGLPSLRDLKWH